MNGAKILIVDDDEWFADQYQATLAAAGYKTAYAPHAAAAIELIDDFQPDGLILDVLLPDVTGITLLHELQSYQDTGALPVILSTNLASSLRLDDLRPYGVKRILDKTTMEPSDIVASVRSVLL